MTIAVVTLERDLFWNCDEIPGAPHAVRLASLDPHGAFIGVPVARDCTLDELLQAVDLLERVHWLFAMRKGLRGYIELKPKQLDLPLDSKGGAR